VETGIRILPHVEISHTNIPHFLIEDFIMVSSWSLKSDYSLSQVDLSYQELEKDILDEVSKRLVKTLATSQEGYVTAREVRFISKGLQMFFFTDNRSRKYQQIKANPNIAICTGPLQIEGLAHSKGHPKEEENRKYLDTFSQTQPSSYKSFNRSGFFDHPNTRIVEINPERFVLYRELDLPDGHHLCIDVLTVTGRKASRIVLTKDGYDSKAYGELTK